MQLGRKFLILSATAVTAVAVLFTGAYVVHNASAKNPPKETQEANPNVVELNSNQLASITVEAVENKNFALEKNAVGNVAYHKEGSSKTTKLVVASVSESDAPFVHIGQKVKVKVAVFPDKVFEGKVSALGGTIWDDSGNPAVDPNTRKVTIQCQVADPKNELYPGMYTDVAIEVQKPAESIAVPMNGVVRKGDGTMIVWVTTDKIRFERRVVQVGLQQNGYNQILDGLKLGELVATDGAIFIDNAANSEN